MSTQLDHHRVIELLPLYVVGALDADEMLAIEAYLQAHPDLHKRLAALEEIMLQVAQNTPRVPLPNDARQRLLARVHEDLARSIQGNSLSGSDKGATLPFAETRHPLLRRWRGNPVKPHPVKAAQPAIASRASWLARLGWIAALFCLLIAFILLGQTLAQQSRIGALRAEVVRLTGEVTRLREVNQQIEEQLLEKENQLALFRDSERSVVLAATELAPAAQGTFYLNSNLGTVIVNGLEPLPIDRTYQLWLVPPDGVPTSVALLSVPTTDLVSQTVNIPVDLRNFAIVDVSIEQAGGSPAITKEAIVLRGVVN